MNQQKTQSGASNVKLTVGDPASGKKISPDLFGIFFEDLNYAADGGLYAELIQNRSFEYHASEQATWGPLSFWELLNRGGAQGFWGIDVASPVHPNNPQYLSLEVQTVGEGLGVMNSGFDGIPVKAGETYDLSFFARQLFTEEHWKPSTDLSGPMPLVARLETKSGEVIAEISLEISGRQWKKLAGELVASRTDDNAVFVLLAKARGGVSLDEISLLPRKTFRNRKNGLRADLAQTIADLKPKFVRFPGGCLAHGHSLGNMYRWKETIGPIETRKQQGNLWGYHQSMGLGYFEYFQFCEDIGAKPLPVVPAGVSCQNSGRIAGVGQQCLPMEEMPAYIQEILDLVEWANGPATSKWGALRAAAGHAEPFGLEYLGVGNEDHISPGFEVRFKMIYDAMKKKHPEIKVVGTVGPAPKGPDFDEGWRIARETGVPIVDEHYYMPPDWFWENLGRYDSYNRSESKVYLGEYAAHDERRKSTLRSALAEAAFMAALERNGDVVLLASYAPLLAKQNHTQWRPDLIYFDNTSISPTINYYVQKLFGENCGSQYLPIESNSDDINLCFSCVRDGASGDVIIKLISKSESSLAVTIDLSKVGLLAKSASCTVLAGDLMAENEFGKPPAVVPVVSTIAVATQLEYRVPANSFSVIRIKSGK